MSLKKKNHTVSKSLLKRWKNQNDKIWVLDIEKQKIEERSIQSTFAIQKYIYVPEVNGVKTDLTERWFEKPENELARFLDFLIEESNDSYNNFNPKSYDFGLLKLGIIGMAYRSSYEIESVIRHLEKNEDLRVKLEVPLDSKEEKHRLAVENMINNIVLSDRRFSNAELTSVSRYHKDLLICDRPGVDLFADLSLFALPVNPASIVFLDASRNIGYNFQPAREPEISDQMVDLLNDLTIKRARKWIVGRTKESLENIFDELETSKVAMRAEKDVQVYSPVSEEVRRTLFSLPDNGNS